MKGPAFLERAVASGRASVAEVLLISGVTHWGRYANVQGMNAVTFSKQGSGGLGIEQLALESVWQWSGTCQRFMDWQRTEILRRQPSQEELQAHRSALKWMLRFARAIYATAADPDYPSREVAEELHGRLIQLEHSWRMIQEPMPEAKADALLREVFPE
jgi:hypothetical protein